MAKLTDLQRNALEKQIEKEKTALERLDKKREEKLAAIESLRAALQQ